MNKQQARKEVARLGYTIHDGVGESGDYGYGSREYYHKPEARMIGRVPQDKHATISRVGREWLISEFGQG